MCGIVGYAGRRNALPILLDGLKRLEYRGYDSAGVAVVGSALQVVKDKGFIANLESQLPDIKGTTGFAHTRWATHGPPSKVNAHPHVDCHGKIALAHNGIIENFASLREKLEARGHKFVSQTDTESLVHLIESYYDGDLEEAIRKALHDVHGSYAILAVHADEPGKVVGARNESPLVVGLGPDENFLASDVPALLRYTDRVLYVMDKEMVVITPKGAAVTDIEGRAVRREPERVTWSLEDAEKGGFEHFMLKEIHEGPKAIQETLRGRLANLEVNGFLSEGVTSVKLVACGTSYHAALVGKYILEEIARIPASAELASEYRYSQGPSERPLVILISQSGARGPSAGMQDPCHHQRPRLEHHSRDGSHALHPRRHRNQRRRNEDVLRAARRALPHRIEGRAGSGRPRLRRTRFAEGSSPLAPSGRPVRVEQSRRDPRARLKVRERAGRLLHRPPRELPRRPRGRRG